MSLEGEMIELRRKRDVGPEGAYLRYRNFLHVNKSRQQNAGILALILNIAVAFYASEHKNYLQAAVLGATSIILFYGVCMPLDSRMLSWEQLLDEYGGTEE